MTFATQRATDVTNAFLDTTAFAEAVTYAAAGNYGSGSSISAVVQKLGDDPLRQVVAFHVSETDVTSPARGDVVTYDSGVWFCTEAGDSQQGMLRLVAQKGELVTYEVDDGTTTANVPITFVFFVGALDENENALVQISSADVSAPVEGDQILRSGESTRWIVNDVREQPGIFELRVVRRKDRT